MPPYGFHRSCPIALPPQGNRNTRAFSLVETAIALGLLVVTLAPLVALCSVGLKQAEASRVETRGALLAQELFTSLRTGSFAEADCFGTQVDLATQQQPLTFHLSRDADTAPTAAAQNDSAFHLELRFAPFPATPPGITATRVTLVVTPHPRGSRGNDSSRATFQAIITPLHPR